MILSHDEFMMIFILIIFVLFMSIPIIGNIFSKAPIGKEIETYKLEEFEVEWLQVGKYLRGFISIYLNEGDVLVGKFSNGTTQRFKVLWVEQRQFDDLSVGFTAKVKYLNTVK